MHANQLGYMPYLRPGTQIFTAVVWRYLSNGVTSQERSIVEIYGHLGGRKRNILGERVRFAAEAIFGNSLSPEDVLQKHTMFGIYSRALSQRTADSWASALINNDLRNPEYTSVKKSPIGARNQLITPDLRSCRTCFIQDMDELGFPTWQLLHGMPPLHHCPYHGDTLATEVKSSPGSNIWKFRLPTGTSIVGPVSCSELASDGYAIYLRLWVDLFNGKLKTIAADSWANYIDLVTHRMGCMKNAIGEISEIISQSWSSSPDRIQLVLGNHVQRDFIKNELEHRTDPIRIAQKLLILSACDSLGIRPGEEITPRQLNIDLPNAQNNQISARERVIRDVLLQNAHPLVMVADMASGHIIRRIAEKTGIHRHKVHRSIASIPSSVLDDLSALGSWPVDSWLTIEKLRRNRTNPE